MLADISCLEEPRVDSAGHKLFLPGTNRRRSTENYFLIQYLQVFLRVWKTCILLEIVAMIGEYRTLKVLETVVTWITWIDVVLWVREFS